MVSWWFEELSTLFSHFRDVELRLPNDSLSYHYGHQYHYHQDLNVPVTTLRFLSDLDFLLSTLPPSLVIWTRPNFTILHLYHYGHQYVPPSPKTKLSYGYDTVPRWFGFLIINPSLVIWTSLSYHSLVLSSRSPLHRHQDLNLGSGQWWGWRGVVNLANRNEAILGLIGLLFKFLHGLHLLLHHHSHLHHRHHHC